jgi:26S proteasome regulatory subunit N11
MLENYYQSKLHDWNLTRCSCLRLQSFEALNQRAVAVVVDPIQSVKGKVVIDAFRLINPQTMMLGQEPRQTTSNLGHLNKPSIQV